MTPPRAARGGGRGALALVVLVLAGLVGASGPAEAAGRHAPDRAPRHPGQDPGSDGPVTLRLDALTPRVVTPEGPGELVVTGRIVNSGALPARDLAVRAQRGAALAGARDTRRTLEGVDPAEEIRPAFTPVAGDLDPGQDVPFALRVPLTGSRDASLALTRPGVYPLLVNVNGTYGAGAPIRLGAVRLLLPVAGLPPRRPGERPSPLAVPPVGQATRVSVLYPIADRPRRLPGIPGAPPLLTDDELATSFAPGGRLAGLVDALGRAAPRGSPAGRSVCLAVDADLLDTAQAMTGGYRVRTPDGPVAGRGSAAAGRWLARLREEARGRCVLALPYADADLVATSRGNLSDLTTAARLRGARRVGEVLGVVPLPGVTWPADGVLDERSLSDLASGGAQTLLLDADVLDGPIPDGGVARLGGPVGRAPRAVALDPLVEAALAPRPAGPEAIGTSPSGPAPLATQDALGTLVLRATASTAGSAGGDGSEDAPTTSVVAPPTRWAADPTEAAAFLGAVGDLGRLGLVRPVDVGTLVREAGPAAPTTSLVAPQAELGPGLRAEVLARARRIRDQQRDLLAASERDRIGTPSPSEFFEPLTADLLRALSAAWRDDPARAAEAVAGVGAQMDTLRSMVRVVQPSGSYSLGSNDAPLLLTVENRLPVAVRVRVVLEPTQGLRTAPIPVRAVPAFGSRQFQVGVQVVRSGQFSVDAQARTPGGEPLGPTARLLLRSTAYGTITVWLTASAAAVLVILASVRIARRVRASRRDRRSRRRRGDRPTGSGPREPPTRELQSR